MAKKSTESISDVVVFMTAFHFDKMYVRKRRLLSRRKTQILSEMKEHHIEAVLSGDTVLSQLGRMDFDAVYDKLSQKTTIKFSKEEMDKDCHNGIWSQMEWAFKLKNEM